MPARARPQCAATWSSSSRSAMQARPRDQVFQRHAASRCSRSELVSFAARAAAALGTLLPQRSRFHARTERSLAVRVRPSRGSAKRLLLTTGCRCASAVPPARVRFGQRRSCCTPPVWTVSSSRRCFSALRGVGQHARFHLRRCAAVCVFVQALGADRSCLAALRRRSSRPGQRSGSRLLAATCSSSRLRHAGRQRAGRSLLTRPALSTPWRAPRSNCAASSRLRLDEVLSLLRTR